MVKYVLNDEKMFSDIADGVAIVINSETGVYYGMNGLGTNIFENILEGANAEDIINALSAITGAPTDCEARVNSFINDLIKLGIVVEGESNTHTVAIDSEIALRDAFTLSVQEFNDAQELLLADPIHEVKDETGWQPSKDALETDEEVVAAKHKKAE